jgi:hypothetical protein
VERVIRTTVGLRPHRDSGFVLKDEKFDEKTVIHDCRFGDATSNISWAGFTPATALIGNERAAQFRQAAEISFQQLQLLAGAPSWGVYVDR